MEKKKTLPIYIDAYRLTQEVLQQTVKFPKEYKFMLGTRMNEALIHLCCLISGSSRLMHKAEQIDQILCQLDNIKIMFRLCSDFKLLSHQHQASIAVSLEKITGQAIAWQKSERRKKP